MRWSFKLKTNFEAYASQSTVHGIGYIFDKKVGILDRCIWLIVVIGAMLMALWMISTSYINWKDNPVITTLKTTTKPITNLDFPAITICANGLHMGLVEKVLYHNFRQWKESRPESKNSIDTELSEFMTVFFQIAEKGGNILDILNTMISPETARANSVIQNQQACQGKKKMRKRGTVDNAVASTQSKIGLLNINSRVLFKNILWLAKILMRLT